MTKPITRKLRCAVYTRKSTEEGLEQEFNTPARPARGLRGLRRQPALRGLGADPRALRRRRLLRRHAGAPGAEAAAGRHRGGAGRRRRGLQDRPAVALADGLREAGRGVRPRRRHLRLGHPVVQHHDLDGPADAQHPALLRPVRARGHRRAHPRQDRGVAAEGHVDGRQRAARLRGEGPEAGGERGRGRDRARDLRAVRRDRLGDGAGAGAAGRGRAHQARQARRQGLPLQAAEQPDLPRPGGAQGHGLSRRARGDHRRRSSGTRCTRSCENARTRAAQHPGADAGAAEGADLRADRRGDVADAHRARATGSTATTSARTC